MSSTKPPQKNGETHDRPWPRRFIQVVAFITGVAGIVADYGFSLLGEEHIPLVLYCMCFGVALGLDPTLWVSSLFGGMKK